VACATARPQRAARAAPVAVAAPKPAPCRTGDYGTVTFQNQSKTATQTVVVDGETACVLPPRQSKDVNLKAGVAHDVIFYVGDTSTIACDHAPLTLAQCQTQLFYCAYP
ncbi:MAG TPA: hypothetical protein VND92_04300, partial [Vicinamibacterales bacterium]|nr:hypothetical protein [Vicinamibacterales bacterium]